MDKETWMNILQLAVIAPFIYSLSEKEKGYFKFGLKIVASAIFFQALPPLYEKAKPLLLAAQQLHMEKLAADKAEPIEGEFSEPPLTRAKETG